MIMIMNNIYITTKPLYMLIQIESHTFMFIGEANK